MPEISRFFGIIIAMFYDDHAPPKPGQQGLELDVVERDRGR
jgi:hypothetical protein